MPNFSHFSGHLHERCWNRIRVSQISRTVFFVGLTGRSHTFEKAIPLEFAKEYHLAGRGAFVNRGVFFRRVRRIRGRPDRFGEGDKKKLFYIFQ